MDIKNLPLTEIGLAVGAVVCYVLLRRMGNGKKDESRSAKLMEKYATLTADNLAATPDEELVEAVVAHVLARAAESRRPDPVAELAVLPQPFTVVYSIWAVCKEMADGSYAAMKRATRHVVDAAVDGLPVVGAAASSAALATLRDTHAAKQDSTAAEAAFRQAVEQEAPLTLCAAYIRDHIPQLLGEDGEDEPAVEEPCDEA